MRKDSKVALAAITAFMSLVSCVLPVPVFVQVPEDDIEGIVYLPLIGLHGENPCKFVEGQLCEPF